MSEASGTSKKKAARAGALEAKKRKLNIVLAASGPWRAAQRSGAALAARNACVQLGLTRTLQRRGSSGRTMIKHRNAEPSGAACPLPLLAPDDLSHYGATPIFIRPESRRTG